MSAEAGAGMARQASTVSSSAKVDANDLAEKPCCGLTGGDGGWGFALNECIRAFDMTGEYIAALRQRIGQVSRIRSRRKTGLRLDGRVRLP